VFTIYSPIHLIFFTPGKQILEKGIEIDDLSNTNVDDYLEDDANQLREDVELVEGVYPKFNVTEYLDGKISPVFFW